MKVESLIFDMDGTLWDSAANVAASWSEVLERQADVDMKVTEADIKSVSEKSHGLCQREIQ